MAYIIIWPRFHLWFLALFHPMGRLGWALLQARLHLLLSRVWLAQPSCLHRDFGKTFLRTLFSVFPWTSWWPLQCWESLSWPRCSLGQPWAALRSHSELNYTYPCLFILLTLGICHSSAIKSFRVIIIDFKDFAGMLDTTCVLFVLEVGLGNVQSQEFQSLLCLFVIFDIYELDSFFVGLDCWNVFGIFQEVISFGLGFGGFLNLLLCAHVPFLFLLVLEIEQDDFEIESWIWGNSWWGASFSVGVLGRADEGSFFTLLHAGKTLIPTFDDHALPDCELERVVGIFAGIEYFSILQSSLVKGKDLLSLGGLLSLSLFVDNLCEFSLNEDNLLAIFFWHQ